MGSTSAEPSFLLGALREIQALKGSGLVRDYAVAGDVTLVFWTEPPSEELLAKLRAGKEALRSERRALPLQEKVRQVIELQKAFLPLLARQRPLRPWERVWEVEP